MCCKVLTPGRYMVLTRRIWWKLIEKGRKFRRFEKIRGKLWRNGAQSCETCWKLMSNATRLPNTFQQQCPPPSMGLLKITLLPPLSVTFKLIAQLFSTFQYASTHSTTSHNNKFEFCCKTLL